MSKSIFYCDVEGTYRVYRENIDKTYRTNELQRFANALDILCEKNGDEEIYFGFISSNKIEDIVLCIKEFLPFIQSSKHIKLGTSFGDRHKVIGNELSKVENHHSEGKAFQIINNIEHVTKDQKYHFHAEIDKVYYADDALLQHKMLKHIFSKRNKNIELIDLIPGIEITTDDVYGVNQRGLDGVIRSILNYLVAQKKVSLNHIKCNTDVILEK